MRAQTDSQMTDDARYDTHKTAPNYLITLRRSHLWHGGVRSQSHGTAQRTAFGLCTWSQGCPVSWCHTVKKSGSFCAPAVNWIL